MKNEKKYLKIYKDCEKIGEIPFLCWMFTTEHEDTANSSDIFKKLKIKSEEDPLFSLFIPTEKELEEHYKQGYSAVWGLKNEDALVEQNAMKPTALRQNIILLMAAMNNEL